MSKGGHEDEQSTTQAKDYSWGALHVGAPLPNRGLMAGLGIQGNKITKITPK